MDEVHVYNWLHTASNKSTAGNITRLFPSQFHISTSSRLTLAEATTTYHLYKIAEEIMYYKFK